MAFGDDVSIKHLRSSKGGHETHIGGSKDNFTLHYIEETRHEKNSQLKGSYLQKYKNINQLWTVSLGMKTSFFPDFSISSDTMFKIPNGEAGGEIKISKYGDTIVPMIGPTIYGEFGEFLLGGKLYISEFKGDIVVAHRMFFRKYFGDDYLNIGISGGKEVDNPRVEEFGGFDMSYQLKYKSLILIPQFQKHNGAIRKENKYGLEVKWIF